MGTFPTKANSQVQCAPLPILYNLLAAGKVNLAHSVIVNNDLVLVIEGGDVVGALDAGLGIVAALLRGHAHDVARDQQRGRLGPHGGRQVRVLNEAVVYGVGIAHHRWHQLPHRCVVVVHVRLQELGEHVGLLLRRGCGSNAVAGAVLGHFLLHFACVAGFDVYTFVVRAQERMFFGL